MRKGMAIHMKNVLFILTDDQRYDALHAMGNRAIITPNLDRLAASGTMFTQAHIPCGTSAAVCMPSRAMLNTGRTLFSLEEEGGTIPPAHTTMAEVFRAAGYETFGTGKWHNGPPAFSRGFCGGDNIFFGGMWDHWNVPTCKLDPTGAYDNIINFTANFSYENDVVKVHCDKFHPGKHSTELLTDTALAFLERREQAVDPFYLYLSYLAPHDPRTMPNRFLEMYNPDNIVLPDNFMESHPFPFGVEDIRDEVLAAWPRNPQEIKRHLAEYYAMVTHLDYEIGRLLDILEEQGQREDTLIVVTGDNGLAVGSHGLMGKQNHYDHSVRVPLLFCGPGIPGGLEISSYVYLLDIFPTLCELLGLSIPASVEGKSFAGMFSDPSQKTREDLYFIYNDLIRSVKDGRYKLIEYRGYTNRTQLFDLWEDPGEINDLSGKKEYTDTLDRLRKKLIACRDSWESGSHEFSRRYWQVYDETIS